MDSKAVKQEDPPKFKAPRLYHKKSRTGCDRCRARRVKCGEQRPACINCSRHNILCIYAKTPAPEATSLNNNTTTSSPVRARNLKHVPRYATPSSSLSSPRGIGTNAMSVENVTLQETADVDMFDISESKFRRRLELRLLANYISSTCLCFSACHNPEVKYIWSVEVPRMAMNHDNLHYATLSISALQLLRQDPENKELIAARQTYQGLSLREHRKAVAQLCSQTADAVCFASMLFLIDAFTALQDRILEPYVPPTSWVSMTQGVGAILQTSIDSIQNDKISQITKVLNSHPRLVGTQSLSDRGNRVHLLGLLSQDMPLGEETWDDETREAYEKTLDYIGGAQIALQNREHQLALCRRIMSFPNTVPRRFFDFLQEQRPRALAVLAHFFALSAGLENIWWVSDTARREISGIQRVLPAKWQELIRGPVSAVGLAPLESQR